MSAYTLLIVESPVLARIIQKQVPANVYVLSTDGFCWTPRYDKRNNRLEAVIMPEKAGFRKELKEQAGWAHQILIATDPDPAGDFIAWSIARYLKQDRIKRVYLQSPGKASLQQVLSRPEEISSTSLKARLRNRFLIREEWNKTPGLPDIHCAALVSVLFGSPLIRSFSDENGLKHTSSRPVEYRPGQRIEIEKSKKENPVYLPSAAPVSTFGLLQDIVDEHFSGCYTGAMEQLQNLFQSVLPSTQQSFISYPRSAVNAFYPQTWSSLCRQYLKTGSLDHLKPPFLQETAGPECVHESVHPLDLGLIPEFAEGELSATDAGIYSIVYRRTLEALRLPELSPASYKSPDFPDILFFPERPGRPQKTPRFLSPYLGVEALGQKLSTTGMAKASSFGKNLDSWSSRGWIRVHNGMVKPGSKIRNLSRNGSLYRQKLTALERAAHDISLKPETVRSILSSKQT